MMLGLEMELTLMDKSYVACTQKKGQQLTEQRQRIMIGAEEGYTNLHAFCCPWMRMFLCFVCTVGECDSKEYVSLPSIQAWF